MPCPAMREIVPAFWTRAVARVPHPKHRSTVRALGHASLPVSLPASVRFNAGYHARLLAAGWGPCRRRLFRSFVLAAEDRATLTTCLSHGRGVVLVMAHHGDFDLAGAWLAATVDRPLCAVVQGPRRGLNLYHRARRRAGLQLAFDKPGRARTLLNALTAEQIVAVALDRRGPRALEVQFCGQAAKMSSTPVRLALRAGAPLLVGSVSRWGDRRVVRLDRVDLGGGPHAAVQAIADKLADTIGNAPAEWLVPADLDELPWLELPVKIASSAHPMARASSDATAQSARISRAASG